MRHTNFFSDSVKCRFSKCRLSVLNLKFDFISDGGSTREEQIALSLKRHLFPHGGREPKAFWICFSTTRPPSEIKSKFKFKALKRNLLKRHLTHSDFLGAQHGGLWVGAKKFMLKMFLCFFSVPELRGRKMFAEDISEDLSADRGHHFYCILEYFWISSTSSQKIAFFWEVFGSFCPLGFCS